MHPGAGLPCELAHWAAAFVGGSHHLCPALSHEPRNSTIYRILWIKVLAPL